jgi:hypothetical protein
MPLTHTSAERRDRGKRAAIVGWLSDWKLLLEQRGGVLIRRHSRQTVPVTGCPLLGRDRSERF